MKYRDGYKYQLWEDDSIQLEDIVLKDGMVLKAPRGFDINTQFIRMTPEGLLTGRSGYAWDGASGPTWDSRYCMRGPLWHDIGYQLMREGLLPLSFRQYFDALMYVVIQLDGLAMIKKWGHVKPIMTIEKILITNRTDAWYQAVRKCAESAALPQNDRPILEAP
jgi:hypothetical protein